MGREKKYVAWNDDNWNFVVPNALYTPITKENDTVNSAPLLSEEKDVSAVIRQMAQQFISGIDPDLKEEIRSLYLANGFTIKEGETDLKPYVYQAAIALLLSAGAVVLNKNNSWVKVSRDDETTQVKRDVFFWKGKYYGIAKLFNVGSPLCNKAIGLYVNSGLVEPTISVFWLINLTDGNDDDNWVLISHHDRMKLEDLSTDLIIHADIDTANPLVVRWNGSGWSVVSKVADTSAVAG